MTSVEYVRMLCKEKNISIAKLERDLGFSNGYLNPKKMSSIPFARAEMIADYLGVNVSLILNAGEQKDYYFDDETAKLAQELFENKELRALFDVQRGMSAEDLRALYGMALALKRKEKGTDDDPGC